MPGDPDLDLSFLDLKTVRELGLLLAVECSMWRFV